MCPRGSTSAAQKLQKTRGEESHRSWRVHAQYTHPTPPPPENKTKKKEALGRFMSKLGVRRPRDGHMATARRIIIIKKYNKIE